MDLQTQALDVNEAVDRVPDLQMQAPASLATIRPLMWIPRNGQNGTQTNGVSLTVDTASTSQILAKSQDGNASVVRDLGWSASITAILRKARDAVIASTLPSLRAEMGCQKHKQPG